MADIEMKSVRPLVENGRKYDNPGFEDNDNAYEKVVCIRMFIFFSFNRMYYQGQGWRERERERDRQTDRQTDRERVFIIIFQKA